MPPDKPSKPLLKPLPSPKKITQRLYGSPSGRPVSNIGQYLLKPTPEDPSGGEILNDEPDILQRVHKQYLDRFQLPPALQPRYLRSPQPMETRRGQAISRGWRNPRSLSK